MEKVLVSIRCLVYNHELYLRQCLDGFVMQKTNFAFEAIVHDDASTDGSAAIIREYAEKYPDIIKPIYETENQYSKKDGSLGRIMNAAIHPDAKYIAFCEGDDYWIDPYKLQKQFDFMESHEDYVLCVHNKKVFYQKERILQCKSKGQRSADYAFNLDDYITGSWITVPLTSFFRKNEYFQIDSAKYKNYRDLIMFYLLLKQGKGFFMKEPMGVYRVHSGGVCSGASFSKYFKECLIALESLYENEKTDKSLRFLCTSLKNNFFQLCLIKDFKTIKYVFLLSLRINKKRVYFELFKTPWHIFVYYLNVIKRKLSKGQ